MQTESPKADPQKRKRRRFRFSLRTLLIVVTLLAVVCGYIGWQAKIVRERRAVLRLLIGSRGYGVYMGEQSDTPGQTAVALHRRISSGHNLTVGKGEDDPDWRRLWLGDEVVYIIWLQNTVPSSEVVRIEKLFPEAGVWQDN
jgi:hypothetical protein